VKAGRYTSRQRVAAYCRSWPGSFTSSKAPKVIGTTAPYSLVGAYGNSPTVTLCVGTSRQPWSDVSMHDRVMASWSQVTFSITPVWSFTLSLAVSAPVTKTT
jgi:hypothetical protein